MAQEGVKVAMGAVGGVPESIHPPRARGDRLPGAAAVCQFGLLMGGAALDRERVMYVICEYHYINIM